jgi:exodeoxyribonuclease VII large subunit
MSSEGFFEVHQRLKGATARKSSQSRARAGSAGTPSAGDSVKPLTVTQLTTVIEKAVKAGVPASVVVRGEVSNASKNQSSGHLYFTLKDSSACISCIMWRDAATRLRFKLEDGAEMIATGKIAIYAPQGRYQLQAIDLQPVGKGALELALKQLQARLAAEGLFAIERKKPLPPYPRRIVLMTSRSTAAIADMHKVLRDFPWLKIMIYPVPVQGDGCGAKIAAALAHLNRHAAAIGGVDVILLARGGGSLEDLWGFNEECVARAMAASLIPIVTGIGHEIDCSIADLVADYHAHTPTEAARVICELWSNVADQLGYSQTRLRRGLRQIAQESRQRFAAIARHEFFRRPMERIHHFRQLLDDRQRALSLAIGNCTRDVSRRLGRAEAALQSHHPRNRVALHRQNLVSLERRKDAAAAATLKDLSRHLDSLERQLRALSPDAVLGRGYSITTLKKTGAVVRDLSQLSEGDRLLTRLRNGQAESVVADSKQMPLFE